MENANLPDGLAMCLPLLDSRAACDIRFRTASSESIERNVEGKHGAEKALHSDRTAFFDLLPTTSQRMEQSISFRVRPLAFRMKRTGVPELEEVCRANRILAKSLIRAKTPRAE